MITRKTRLITVGIILFIFLLLLVWLWLALKSPDESVPPVVETTPEQAQIFEEKTPSLLEKQLVEEQETRNQSAGATTVAKLFVERYGSYSNEAKFQNLIDVLPLMTASFADETRALIASSTSPETFYGVTTRVLTVSVEAMNETAGLATVRMQTQREIAQGSTQNTSVTYQEIRLELEKEAGVWKVASAGWL